MAQADAGVEAVGDDVGQAVVGGDLDGQLGVSLRQLDEQRRDGDRQRGAWRIQAQRADDAALRGGDVVGGVGDVGQGGPQHADEGGAGLGQAHAARGPREQRLAQAGLDGLHGVAHRGRAHVQVVGGGREAATPVHGEDDGQVRQQRAIHS